MEKTEILEWHRQSRKLSGMQSVEKIVTTVIEQATTNHNRRNSTLAVFSRFEHSLFNCEENPACIFIFY